MPTHPLNHDPMDFAIRLKDAMSDAGHNTGHGAGSFLARRYKSSAVTANAWLNGDHMPSPDRVRKIADDYGVRFEWLYFGEGPKRGTEMDKEDSQSPLTLSAHELELVRRYRASGDTLRGLVDAALIPKEAAAPSKPTKAPKRKP